jgi:MBG domain (YGX type)/Beta-propeller repeat
LIPSPRLFQLRLTLASIVIAVTTTASLFAQTPAQTPAQIASHPTENAATESARLAQNYGKLPLSFEANQGQSDPQVRFISRSKGYSLFLTDTAAILSLTKSEQPNRGKIPTQTNAVAAAADTKPDIIRMEFANAGNGTHTYGINPLPGTANYLIGNDLGRWHTNIPTYAKVQCTSVYPGVDLIYYGNQRQLEFDFVVAPGADPASIHLQFTGAEHLQLGPDGELVLHAASGDAVFHKPVIYQEIAGQRRTIPGSFQLEAANLVGFTLAGYDRFLPLIIDPVLAYSTYLGGGGNGAANGDTANAIAADASGNAYIAGQTYSANFPTTAASLQTTGKSSPTAFVTKLDPTGTSLLYSTYLGGTGSESANAIAVDSAGNATIAGVTYSTDFPTTAGVLQRTNKAGLKGTAFVARLNPSGTALLYSTYLGGTGSDSAVALALDASGNSYIAGATTSTDFPATSGAFQTQPRDMFVAKLNPLGTALAYATYIGGTQVPPLNFCPADMCYYTYSGNSGDTVKSLAIDSAGDAYITGQTYFTDISANPPAYRGGLSWQIDAQQIYPTTLVSFSYVYAPSAFLATLNPTGSTLSKFSYIGGSGQAAYIADTGDPDQFTFCGDTGNSIAIDGADNLYIAGSTCSTDLAVTSGALQQSNLSGGAIVENQGYYQYSGFVTSQDIAGNPLYTTYLGGTVSDSATVIAADNYGNAYVAGYTQSPDFPVTADAFQSTNNGAPNYYPNAFVSALNPQGSALLYSTFLGGTGNRNSNFSSFLNGDKATALAVNASGNTFVAGTTFSSDFPTTTGAYQSKNNALANNTTNAFVARLNIAPSAGPQLTVSMRGGSRTYGAPNPKFTWSISGLTGSGTLTVSPETSATAGSPPGLYPVSATVSGASADQIMVIPSTLRILKAPIHIEASNLWTIYGQAPPQPTAFYLYGLVNGDPPSAVSGAPALSTNVTAQTPPGAYRIGVQLGTLSSANYAIDLFGSGEGNVWVYKAVLTAAATSLTITKGDPIPAFTYSLSGFVNSDTPTSVSGAPVLTTTATSSSPPGHYSIKIATGSLTSPKYNFKLTPGVLTILP